LSRPRRRDRITDAAVALKQKGLREDHSMDNTVHERISQDIAETPVVLFMKGTPVFPQCGFSAAVVQILSHLGVKFKGIDVLADPEIRQGIKEFSNWPTIPQLYVKGEFVGGCDIIREMFQSGELQQLFEEKGVARRAA
jgi:monothiol glutaredoxin